MKAYIEKNSERLDAYVRMDDGGFYWFCAEPEERMVAKIDFADLSKSREVELAPDDVASLLEYVPGMVDEVTMALYDKARNAAERVFEPYIKDAGLMPAQYGVPSHDGRTRTSW